jgi:ankyrin repeat protein
LFVARGADVNRVDAAGYSALLVAVSIDFGDPLMVDFLVASGARTDMRNPAGETALDLARKYRHVTLIRCLERYNRQTTTRAVPADRQ